MRILTLIQRLPPWAEFVIVCGLCWGVFAFRSQAIALDGLSDEHGGDAAFAGLVRIELALGAAAFVFLWLRGWPYRQLPLAVTWGTTGAGFLLLLIAILLHWIAVPVAMALGGDIAPLREVAGSFRASLPVAAAASLVNGAYEELFLAGYIFKSLEKHGMSLTIGSSALLRLLAHTYQGPVGAFSVLCFGVFFGWAYWRYRQLWPLICAHITIDFLALARL